MTETPDASLGHDQAVNIVVEHIADIFGDNARSVAEDIVKEIEENQAEERRVLEVADQYYRETGKPFVEFAEESSEPKDET